MGMSRPVAKVLDAHAIVPGLRGPSLVQEGPHCFQLALVP